MIKRISVILSCFLLLFCSYALAAPLEVVNGLHCWNGDMNYPYWSHGNKLGMVIDVSSAEILNNEDSKWSSICVFQYTVHFNENRLAEKEYLYFKEDKSTGQAYYKYGYENEWHPVRPNGPGYYMNDAYYMVKSFLGQV